jgi:hypothetical protein
MGYCHNVRRVSIRKRPSRPLKFWSSAMAPSTEIRWPSGIVQTLTDVKGDQQIQVDEPAIARNSVAGEK